MYYSDYSAIHSLLVKACVHIAIEIWSRRGDYDRAIRFVHEMTDGAVKLRYEDRFAEDTTK